MGGVVTDVVVVPPLLLPRPEPLPPPLEPVVPLDPLPEPLPEPEDDVTVAVVPASVDCSDSIAARRESQAALTARRWLAALRRARICPLCTFWPTATEIERTVPDVAKLADIVVCGVTVPEAETVRCTVPRETVTVLPAAEAELPPPWMTRYAAPAATTTSTASVTLTMVGPRRRLMRATLWLPRKTGVRETCDPAVRSLRSRSSGDAAHSGTILAMVPEAPLERIDAGVVPAGPGWFVLNATDARWSERPGRGALCWFEGDAEGSGFPQLGLNVSVLGPGEPMAMYHQEADQEDFLVLEGEALLIVEGEERPLRRWDLVHCPAGTSHVILGAGDGPCVVLCVGARVDSVGEGWGAYPVCDAARRRGCGVDQETTVPDEAYERFPPSRPSAYRKGWLPGS